METKEKPLTKAAQRREEREKAIEELRELIKPGDTVFTILRQVSRSGMSRHISLVIGGAQPVDISWLVARALDMRRADDGGLVTGGCGMDMGSHLVYNLSRTLFRDSFVCIGKDCPANDHTNAYQTGKGGRCMVCGKDLGTSLYTRSNAGRNEYRVCSKECARGPWKHSDGGYALRHRWL